MKLLLQPVDMAWAGPGGGTHEEGVQEASPHGVLTDRGQGQLLRWQAWHEEAGTGVLGGRGRASGGMPGQTR